jgi:hypothetical protein
MQEFVPPEKSIWQASIRELAKFSHNMMKVKKSYASFFFGYLLEVNIKSGNYENIF